jgi:hypothetical protein
MMLRLCGFLMLWLGTEIPLLSVASISLKRQLVLPRTVVVDTSTYYSTKSSSILALNDW